MFLSCVLGWTLLDEPPRGLSLTVVAVVVKQLLPRRRSADVEQTARRVSLPVCGVCLRQILSVQHLVMYGVGRLRRLLRLRLRLRLRALRLAWLRLFLRVGLVLL